MKQFTPFNAIVKQVTIPPSKSYAQRAIVAAILGKKPVKLLGLGTSADVLNLVEIAKQLGAEIKTNENSVTIIGGVNLPNTELNVGESGLGIRLIAMVCAVLKGNFTLNGKGSLLQRPIKEFETILPQLGIKVTTNNGFLPMRLTGNAIANDLIIDGSNSSQYLSGLLMALPILNADINVTVNNLSSKPYIDITLDVLQSFGIPIKTINYSVFKIAKNQIYNSPKTYTIEGDYSGASIWMVHGALQNGIQINGLVKNTTQGDKMMLNALKSANVVFKWNGNSLEVEKSTIQPFNFDATQCPDLFPALVVLAAAANGTSIITGTNRLIHKESNRAEVLKKEFKKLGLSIKLENNKMYIIGTGKLMAGEINSNNDHRIAMAGAVAAILTKKGVFVNDAESVNKSYPNFWKCFPSL